MKKIASSILFASMAAMHTLGLSHTAYAPARHTPRPHWKETQPRADKEAALKKAQEKRDRKARKKAKDHH